jgi:SAM-dependent methyltransferase
MSLRDKIAMRAARKNLYSRPEFWNGKARAFTGSAVSMWANLTLNELYEREQFAFVDTVLSDVHGLSILDVGCGTGRLSRHLARRGARVTAFDFAEDTIRIARETEPGLPIDYKVMSTFDLEAQDAFDVVVALGNVTVAARTACELSDALSRFHRALHPGGTMVLIEPFHAGFLHRVLDLSFAEAVRLVEAAGFEVLAQRELHFWPARLPLSLRNWPPLLTRFGYATGQAALALGGSRLGLGDYKGLAARKNCLCRVMRP